jgi:hypothetical protein
MSVCRSQGMTPRVLHEVRFATSQIAYVGRGQGVALVPSSTRKLAPENVVVRTRKEKVMVVTAALLRNTRRFHPIVEEAVVSLKRRELKSKNRMHTTALSLRRQLAAKTCPGPAVTAGPERRPFSL